MRISIWSVRLPENRLRAVVACRSRNAASRMSRRATQPQALDRRPVLRQLRNRPHPKRLVERQLGMVRLSFRPAFLALQVRGSQYGADFRILKPRQEASGHRREVSVCFMGNVLEV